MKYFYIALPLLDTMFAMMKKDVKESSYHICFETL